MPNAQIHLSRFVNRTGSISWRVSGWLDGERIRRNFKTREEAAAERDVLTIKQAQSGSGLRVAPTFLTDDQLREAESAFRRLKDRPLSLSGYLDFAISNYRVAKPAPPLPEAIRQYLAKREWNFSQNLLSAPQLKTIKDTLGVFERHFSGTKLLELTASVLTDFCQKGTSSLKTYNNRRGILSTFLKFAVSHAWMMNNPIAEVPHYRIAHRRGSATTLSAAQAQALMEDAEVYENATLVTYFALCLFAGIRPCIRTGEILKLKPEHVRLDTGSIHIEPEVSKVRMKRLVTIQPNLAAWLKAYPLERYPIIPINVEQHRNRFIEKHALSHDLLRHTFISMYVAKYRSLGDAALQAGNSETIIRRHYLDLKSREEADAFFSILPKHAAPAA